MAVMMILTLIFTLKKYNDDDDILAMVVVMVVMVTTMMMRTIITVMRRRKKRKRIIIVAIVVIIIINIIITEMISESRILNFIIDLLHRELTHAPSSRFSSCIYVYIFICKYRFVCVSMCVLCVCRRSGIARW